MEKKAGDTGKPGDHMEMTLKPSPAVENEMVELSNRYKKISLIYCNRNSQNPSTVWLVNDTLLKRKVVMKTVFCNKYGDDGRELSALVQLSGNPRFVHLLDAFRIGRDLMLIFPQLSPLPTQFNLDFLIKMSTQLVEVAFIFSFLVPFIQPITLFSFLMLIFKKNKKNKKKQKKTKALCDLEEHSIAHMDIKPSNMMLDEKSENLVVIDLGLAVQLGPFRNSVLPCRIILPSPFPPFSVFLTLSKVTTSPLHKQ